MSTQQLSAEQVRAFSDTLFRLYDETKEPTPLEPIVDAVGGLMPSTWTSADEFFLKSGQHKHRAERNFVFLASCKQGAEKYGHQNPVLTYPHLHGFAPALKISDFVTFRQFSQTGYYTEVVGKLSGFRDQAGVYTRVQDGLLLFTVHREKSFTEEERLLLELVQPHLERILHRSTQYASLPCKSLTPREREVLHWIAEGKRDEEISMILKTRPRTIKQHVRAILSKLDVETRTAAAAVAWRARMAEPSTPQVAAMPDLKIAS